MENSFEKPNVEQKERQPNWQNGTGDRGAAERPPVINEVIRSRKCILKMNALWFIMICEKRRRCPMDVDCDEVVIITVD